MSIVGPRRIRIVRIVMLSLAIVGIGFTVRYNTELARLRDIRTDLRKRVGFLEVQDPAKVAISYVPFDKEIIPSGVDQAYVWRYRMYVPANYGPSYQMQEGLVAADSPRGRGGSGGTWTSGKAESSEVLATLALIYCDGKWMFCLSGNGGSSTTQLPVDFKLDSLSDFVVEVPVNEKEPTRDFDEDEAICLLRLREKTIAKKRNGKSEHGLYQGFVVYLYGADHKAAFTAWSNGETNSMQETKL